MTKMRLSEYWITRARQVIKSVLSECYICKRYNSLAFKYLRLTNLPKHSLNLINPFQHTDVDYTDHIWVEKEKKTTKIFTLIFTCLNIRAVHIEIEPDMGMLSFVQALTCFTNIYGIPSHVYSDNAKSFNTALGKSLLMFT